MSQVCDSRFKGFPSAKYARLIEVTVKTVIDFKKDPLCPEAEAGDE